jgi:hypothetical protein
MHETVCRVPAVRRASLRSLTRSFRRLFASRAAEPLCGGRPAVEFLEDRCLLSSGFVTPRPPHPIQPVLDHRPGTAVPGYVLAHPAGSAGPQNTTGPTGYNPGQLQHAYGFDQIKFGSVIGDGSGQTIGIVDAYDDPSMVSSTDPGFLASDLHLFDLAFRLPDPVFTKVNQTGGTAYPPVDPQHGWELETALDVEWAHAMAPRANILLVESTTSNFSDLDTAVVYAARQGGACVVSMSWGASEFPGEQQLDGNYTTPAKNVTFLAASGDNGSNGAPIYPSVSPNVVAVGGTTLHLDANGNRTSAETGWSGSGGGISTMVAQPNYQKGVVTQSSTRRTTPDVAYDSDPNTGVSVLDSFTQGSQAPWITVGGTSAASPQWAALIAIADQGRALNTKGGLDGPSQTLPALYAMAQANFNDIISGSNGAFSAGPGYDLVTGRGTPIAPVIAAALQGPVIQVSAGSQAITGGGSLSLNAYVGTTTTQTFTVKNAGPDTLTLSDPITLPPGFTLQSDFGSLSLAPGASTTFVVKVDTSQVAKNSGTVSFATNDPNNNPFSFTLTANVVGIVNDSDPAFSATSGWQYASGPNFSQYYKSDTHYLLGQSSSSETASWTYSLSPGVYEVSATWVADTNRATNAQYTILLGSTVLGTATVNQRNAPSGFSDNGAQWQDLGAGQFTVTSAGTLTVRLAGTGNGYLIADGMRVQFIRSNPTSPVAQVYDGTTLISNGSGSDNFGGTFVNLPVNKTFTVKNAGTATLTLSDPITLPSGFTLVSDFGSTSLAPGASTTFVVQLTAAAAGNFSGTLSFGTNDNNNNPYALTILGTVASKVILDDDQAGFTATSGWQFASGGGFSQYYNSDTHYILGQPSSSQVATWSFNVGPGVYRVSATWVADPNRASNAQYTIALGSTVLGTATVNQQNAPNSFSDAGAVWGDLGAGQFTATSAGTLTVQLAGTGNGYLIADAMRVQFVRNLANGPVAQVFDGSTLIPDGSGSDNFGSTFVNLPITKTFTVKNAGNATLTLSDPITLPSGFTLVSDFGSTSLAPSATTTFSVQLTAAAAGIYSGTLSFGTNDSNNNPYSFTILGTVANKVILDDDQAGFTATSGWQFASGGGFSQYYNSDTHYILGQPSSSETATWSFNVAPGVYEVSATWVADPNRASNAQYTIALGSTVLGTATVNQRNAPNGFSDGGALWQDLGAGQFTVTSAGSLTVQLAGTGNGYLIADAMRVQFVRNLSNGPVAQVYDGSTLIADGSGSDNFGTTFVGLPVAKTFTVKNAGNATLTLSDPITLPSGFTLVSDFGSTSLAPGASTTFVVQLTAAAAGSYSGTLSFGTNDSNNNPYSFTVSGTVATTIILNDSAPGFSATSGWSFASGSNYTQYYNSDTHYILGQPSSSEVASWTFNVGPGVYEVSATWVADPNRATNAQYTILLGSTVLGTATINQQNAPNGFSDAGALWQDLGAGQFVINAPGTLTIQLAGTGNGYLIADAMRVQKVG